MLIWSFRHNVYAEELTDTQIMYMQMFRDFPMNAQYSGWAERAKP